VGYQAGFTLRPSTLELIAAPPVAEAIPRAVEINSAVAAVNAPLKDTDGVLLRLRERHQASVNPLERDTVVTSIATLIVVDVVDVDGLYLKWSCFGVRHDEQSPTRDRLARLLRRQEGFKRLSWGLVLATTTITTHSKYSSR